MWNKYIYKFLVNLINSFLDLQKVRIHFMKTTSGKWKHSVTHLKENSLKVYWTNRKRVPMTYTTAKQKSKAQFFPFLLTAFKELYIISKTRSIYQLYFLLNEFFSYKAKFVSVALANIYTDQCSTRKWVQLHSVYTWEHLKPTPKHIYTGTKLWTMGTYFIYSLKHRNEGEIVLKFLNFSFFCS